MPKTWTFWGLTWHGSCCGTEQAFDMAYMLNGKYALKHDPTLTGRHNRKYL